MGCSDLKTTDIVGITSGLSIETRPGKVGPYPGSGGKFDVDVLYG